jgi:hypothetical protein
VPADEGKRDQDPLDGYDKLTIAIIGSASVKLMLFPVPIIFSALFGVGNILCFGGILYVRVHGMQQSRADRTSQYLPSRMREPLVSAAYLRES